MILGFFFNLKSYIVMHSTHISRNRYYTFMTLNLSSEFLIKVTLFFSVSSSLSLLSKLCNHTFDQIGYKVLKSTVIISNKHIIGKYTCKIWNPDSKYRFFSLFKKYMFLYINNIMLQLEKSTQTHKIIDALFPLPHLGIKIVCTPLQNLGVNRKLFSFETWAGIAIIHSILRMKIVLYKA